MKALNNINENQESKKDEMNLHKPKLEGKKQKESKIQSLNIMKAIKESLNYTKA